MKYTLKSGVHTRNEGKTRDGKPNRVRYMPGDEINLSRAEVQALGDRVKPLVRFEDEEVEVPETPSAAPTPEPSSSSDTDTPQADPEWVELMDVNVMEAQDLITSLDDPDDLSAARLAEESRERPRVTVLKAIESRLASLEG